MDLNQLLEMMYRFQQQPIARGMQSLPSINIPAYTAPRPPVNLPPQNAGLSNPQAGALPLVIPPPPPQPPPIANDSSGGGSPVIRAIVARNRANGVSFGTNGKNGG